jgi:hypothetical protein
MSGYQLHQLRFAKRANSRLEVARLISGCIKRSDSLANIVQNFLQFHMPSCLREGDLRA